VLNAPSGVGLDATANVYATNFTVNDVTVYAAHSYGNIAPMRTITSPPKGGKMQNPSDVAFDAIGNIFVSAAASNSISVYAPGASGHPKRVQYISGGNTGLKFSSSLAVSATGVIYVANYLSDSN